MDNGDETRARCLQAFIELLREKGYRGVRMVEVARRAEVSRPTLYRYFSSREEMFRELADNIFGLFYDQAEHYFEDYDDSMSLAMNKLAANVAYNQIEWVQALADSGADDIFISQLRKYFARITGSMLRHTGRKAVSAPQLEMVTAMMAGACYYPLKHWLKTGMQQSPADIAQVLTHTFNARLLDLLAQPEEAQDDAQSN